EVQAPADEGRHVRRVGAVDRGDRSGHGRAGRGPPPVGEPVDGGEAVGGGAAMGARGAAVGGLAGGVILDALASETPYLDHLAPIWRELPEDLRGAFFCVTHEVRDRASALGLPGVYPKLVREARQPHRQPIMVAAYNDLMRCKGRSAVFV